MLMEENFVKKMESRVQIQNPSRREALWELEGIRKMRMVEVCERMRFGMREGKCNAES